MKVVLLLLYIWNGQVKLEQVPTASMEACVALAKEKIDKQMLEPSFDAGLFADCIPLQVTEASAK